MNIKLRVAISRDHAFLHELNHRAYEDVVVQQFGIWDNSAQQQRFDMKLQQASFRIIELSDQPVGAIWSSEHENHIILHELLILPEFQNRGIGSQVLDWELVHAGIVRKPVRLHSLLLNRAQKFYGRHGFIEIGRNKIYVEMERAE